MSQYALSISLPAVYAETNFVASPCNEAAFKRITSWPAWRVLLISGTSGSGKTHLGHIWAARANAEIIDCKIQPLRPQALSRNLWLDNIEYCNEENLFHTLNYAKEQEISLLLTAAFPAGLLPFTLPDLTSRLRALPTAHIDAPDDEVLAAVLRKQFADRQIKIPDDVIAYLLTHIERSFAAIARAVDVIDKQTLENKRGITIPFIRQIL